MEPMGSVQCSQESPLDPILSHMNLAHIIIPYLKHILILSSYLLLGL